MHYEINNFNLYNSIINFTINKEESLKEYDITLKQDKDFYMEINSKFNITIGYVNELEKSYKFNLLENHFIKNYKHSIYIKLEIFCLLHEIGHILTTQDKYDFEYTKFKKYINELTNDGKNPISQYDFKTKIHSKYRELTNEKNADNWAFRFLNKYDDEIEDLVLINM